MPETIENQACIVIAIVGASASGKSLIASTIYKELKEELDSNDIDIISEDAYYKDQTHLTMDEREQTNYDHPDSMDHYLLVEHLRQLKQGKPIQIPEYDYAKHNRKTSSKHFEPKKIIILEGILLLMHETIRNEINVSIFVDAPLDICSIRRLQRDLIERGRSMDSVISQYRKTVRPMFLEFIEPSKQYADIIIPKGGKNRIAIDILKAQIKQLLSKK
ncbi:uridine kinase [[Haemophilus] ducreyi]|uniref:uridine kinase n=1 Tax=Haemophilus ducreyi TaxID=730 RepID=UPI000655AEFA|nr:uridine kinase [[Haemophilus] ducreyi]AKO45760.1 uridine kinase [[Haemophilus] ducreyi]AKO47147.1 uridine kinase [[Haemophilus] ducreyi]AKO48509.1 uridine kinase [[Haemophilus] ducreyi]AKO49879.1 uridine kinase [[Haemophilus] ducreyi]ANF62412.1 uridine kinase [[Haemophilus] ducreyi]